MALPAGMIAERRLIHRLLRANAVTPADALPLAELRAVESSRLTDLIGRGVVRESPPDRYYLDAPALGEYWFGIRRKRAILILAIVVATVAVLAFAMVTPN